MMVNVHVSGHNILAHECILERYLIKTAGSVGAMYGGKSAGDRNDYEEKQPCMIDETQDKFASRAFLMRFELSVSSASL